MTDNHEPQLVTLVKEIHAAVTTPPIVFSGVDPETVDLEALAEQFRSSQLIATAPDVDVVRPNQITLEVGVTKRELNDLDKDLGGLIHEMKLNGGGQHWPPDEVCARLDDIYDLVADRLAELSRKASGESPTREPDALEPDALEPEHPETDYGVRVFYDDGTAEDIPNISGLQVVDTRTTTFPFGFMTPDGEGDPVAGFWRTEDGEFEEFDTRQQPTPNGGW